MNTITATDMKQSFGSKLQNISNGALIITKRNRNHAVLLGYEEYSHLKELEEHEDILFGLAAQKAIKQGMASQKESQNLLDSIK